jgi:natural product biosynthesis luciferase-like monooxygenase protein
MSRALSKLTPAQKRELLARALTRQRQARPEPSVTRDRDQARLWHRCGPPRPLARLRLLCVPPLAAGLAYFADWAEVLGPHIEVWVMRRPGREACADVPDNELLRSLERARAASSAALAELPEGELALFGHSMGARLVVMLAEQLDAAGRPPVHAIVSGCAAPGQPDNFPDAAPDDDELVTRLWPSDELQPDPNTRARLLRAARCDAALARELRTAAFAPLRCPLTALASHDDPHVPLASVLPWSEQTLASFTLELVEGGHDFPREASASTLARVAKALGSQASGDEIRALDSEPQRDTDLDLGLFFFSCDEADFEGDAYQLVHAAADLAERAGMRALWLPERHFHSVGGLFPNPAVLAAALATRTRRIRLRSGSVVMPLHDPIRVAEEWSMVDNLSGGRAELSVVPGWNPNDFVLAPQRYESRWAATFEGLETLRELWAGRPITRTNGRGDAVAVRIHPRPRQAELPIWITTSARDESFARAGRIGANVLTALLIQSVDELERRVALYREARADAGLDPRTGRVALMVHTYVGADEAQTRAAVREPFLAYMRSVQSLWRDRVESLRVDDDDERARIIEMVFERYYQRSTLFGSIDECLRRARRFRAAGVDELACAIDFGVSVDQTMAGLERLARLRLRLRAPVEVCRG